jgi:uncharacterized membrane protein YdjX (TVP38/TMEM64 family)
MSVSEKNSSGPTSQQQIWVRVLILLSVVGLTIVLVIFHNRIDQFVKQIPGMGWLAYPAIFFVSILANASIIVPLPTLALTAIFGAFFNPILVAVLAGSGAAIGEISGFLAGYSGQVVVDRSKWHDRLEIWMKKYGGITILVLAAIPNPLFDAAGIIAGALKMPLPKFLFWCAIGKIIKMLMFAYMGDALVKLFPF